MKSTQEQDFPGRLAPHGDFKVLRQLEGGHRNLSLLVQRSDDALFVAKTTTRSDAALAWAARLQAQARQIGIETPVYIPAPNGTYTNNGLTLEPFVEGRPARAEDLASLRPSLARLRKATSNWPQRPGFASATALLSIETGGDVDLNLMPTHIAAACRAAWQKLAGRRETAIHGDLNPSNLLIGAGGQPILLDWDEARRDSPLFDLAALGYPSKVLAHAALAWEVAVGCQTEPAYAKSLAHRLLELSS